MNEIQTRLPSLTPPTATRTKDPKVEAGVAKESRNNAADIQAVVTTKNISSEENSLGVVTKEKLTKAVENIQAYIDERAKHELELTVDEDSGRSIVKVIDSNTGETVRQFPPEEILDIAKNIRENNGKLIEREA
ncbi:MAG: flagellar protein FlaG [Gammaproteobacteria bacterium]|nr:flagellar protein FlaG [Gammaproteobacteria bacterium]MDH5694288.1 flagellar protein FlaG [Gammaproteobacteria bacterium]